MAGDGREENSRSVPNYQKKENIIQAIKDWKRKQKKILTPNTQNVRRSHNYINNFNQIIK